MTAIDDFISRWTQPPMSYILIAIVIAIIVFILVRHFYKPKSEHFKGESIEYVVKELNLIPIFKEQSRKCKKGKLYHNLGMIKVRRVVMCNVKFQTDKDIKNVNQNINKKFIAFKTGSFFSELPIFSFFFKSSFYIIDNEPSTIEKHKESDTWVVSPDIFMHKFADVWHCSESGKVLLTELIYKRTYENETEVILNTPKRFVWYNDIYANKLTATTLEAKLEQDKYSKGVERETGVKK